MYINPRLKSDIILDAYASGEDETFISQMKGRENTFGKFLDKIGKFHPQPGKILDVGTAGGSFLHAAKQRGWDVYGCEPNRWLCDWSKNIMVLILNQGRFLSRNISKTFDVVTIWDVLEHTPDPKEVLREGRRILKKKGLLVVNYPDIGSWIARIMGRKWVFLLSVHLYYFTRRTMVKMLQDSGFSVLKIKPHYQQLALGYLFSRSKAYVGHVGAIGENISRMLGMGGVNIPYWIGQTLVIAQKEQ